MIDFDESLITELIKKISLEEFQDVREMFKNENTTKDCIERIDKLWNMAYEELWED